MIDRAGLAGFLRQRRESLQPEDVGLPRGQRRRTRGLRREEIATLCHMSSDYYSRLEQERGPQPSEQMAASIAQGLHLSLDERDHLFRLAGLSPPVRAPGGDHIAPGLLRIFDRLGDTPAEIVTELGETLRQTPLGVALTGDTMRFAGPARSRVYRWFTDPGCRRLYPPEEHAYHSRVLVSGLRQVSSVRGPGSRAAALADLLLAESAEFRTLWEQHEIGLSFDEVKNYVHPEVGPLRLNCQRLLDPSQSHLMLVFTAEPGTEDAERLRLLSALGTHRFHDAPTA